MSTAANEDAVVDAAETTLIRPSRVTTSVDWDRLKRIAAIVQDDLDDEDELDDHHEYESVFAMWKEQLQDVPDARANIDAAVASTVAQAKWYSKANEYWEDEAKCSLDDNGVLGGFAQISPADTADSKAFIVKLALKRPQWKRELAVDCGAGIGRVTKQLLLPMFDQVDLVEQSERLLRGVPAYVKGSQGHGRVRKLYCMGLQDFDPEPKSYDLIWVQWVSSHLTDVDFVDFLKRCKAALAPHGWIGIKENVILMGTPYEIDREDSSFTRSDVYFKSIFQQAGMELLAEQQQTNFPDDLYPVKMYALA